MDEDIASKQLVASGWQIDFFDDFDSFNTDNWQDQMLWVNHEDQCYVPDNQFNTREVSNGTLKLRVIDLLSLIHISEPTRQLASSRMPSSA